MEKEALSARSPPAARLSKKFYANAPAGETAPHPPLRHMRDAA